MIPFNLRRIAEVMVLARGGAFSARMLTRLSPERLGEGWPLPPLSWQTLWVRAVVADGRADLGGRFFFSQKASAAVFVPQNKRRTAGGHESTVALTVGWGGALSHSATTDAVGDTRRFLRVSGFVNVTETSDTSETISHLFL